MKSFTNKLILFLFVVGIFNSCRKKEVINIYPYDIHQFFSQNIVSSQFFTIDASKDYTITGTKGTKINFKTGCLKTPSGIKVTGLVNIELKEIYSKGDMILSGIFPLSLYMEPLISGGEIFLNAKQNGNELMVNDSGIINLKMPGLTDDTAKMYVYYSDSTRLSTTSEWRWGAMGNLISRTPDSMGLSMYDFNIANLKWINCDHQWGITPVTTVIANLPDTSFNPSNTILFISFKGINLAADLHESQYGKYTIGGIPVNKDVTFVAIAIKNGQYYSSFADSKIVNNHLQNMTLTSTTLSQIKTQLAALQ